MTELAGLNDDMANFLSSTLVGILMVDRDLNIRKFTEYISSEFNVVDQDVGRSVRYITYNFATIDLIQQCREVLKTMVPMEEHCASVAGKTYMIRIAPYRVVGQSQTQNAMDAAEGTPSSINVPKKLQGLVLTFVDTTKQVDDQEQIEEMAKALREAVKAGKEKETFLSHVSHDMRTPMTAIFGLTQLSLAVKNVPDEVRDNLEKIMTSSSYLLNLIEEILETSRINAGKVVTVDAAVKEEQVLNSVATMAGEQCRNKGLHFTMNIQGSQDRYVMMDAQHVERVLMNVMSNSIKFTPAGGNVTFSTSVQYEDGRAIHTYVIKDTGIGISESMQKRMFLPFEFINSLVAEGQRTPEEHVIEQEAFLRLSSLIETELTALEREVLHLNLTGMPTAQIAKMLGREEKSADNALQRAKGKLKKRLS